MLTTTLLCTALSLFLAPTTTQETAFPGPQCEDFASSYTLSPDQIARANITPTTARNVEIALNFERSNHATNPSDPFYTTPTNFSATLPPGTLLSLEPVTNTTPFTLPPALSLSRLTYTTTTTNSTPIAASAYILWPYLPATTDSSYSSSYSSSSSSSTNSSIPLILWAHGTSGTLPPCAPSLFRNLWAHHTFPFTAASAGYAVLAPDYPGLGVASAPHPYLSNFVSANALLDAVPAAHAAFPATFSDGFVVAGHSQGGAVAWAAAVQNAAKPVPGYLGTVAVAPGPTGGRLLGLIELARGTWVAAMMAWGVWAAFPGTARGELWSAAGLARWEGVMEGVGGCSGVGSALFPTGEGDWVSEGFGEHWATRRTVEEGDYVGREVGGPVLVVQGKEDVAVGWEGTAEAVRRTCAAWPGSEVEFAVFEGVGHGGVLFAAQKVWLAWVADRFAGREVRTKGCWNSSYAGVRAAGEYQGEGNYFLEWATRPYQVV